MTKPRILFLDIETRPATAHVWGLFDVNVAVSQIMDPGGVLCFGAKWSDSKDMLFFSDWGDGHKTMIGAAHMLLSEADAVCTFNGDRFDIPKLQGEFLKAGLKPPPPLTSIDVYKAVKKLGFLSNKLAFVGPHLGMGDKLSHEGHGLWVKVIDGDAKAQKRMERYCCQDVRLLERVYQRVKPYMVHPHLGTIGKHECGHCGSSRLQSRGVRRTKAMYIARLHCQACGAWSDGVRTKA